MARFTTAEEVFDSFGQEAHSEGLSRGDARKHLQWMKEKMAEANKIYPFMANMTLKDYFDYRSRYNAGVIKESQISNTISEGLSFWRAAYDFDPLNIPGRSNLEKMLAKGKMEPLILGKIYGKVTMSLLPGIGALPVHDPDFNPPLDYAATDSVALFYPDGHPSEDMVYQNLKESPPPTAPTTRTATIKPNQDDRLRRCACLGWVIQEEAWKGKKKTGHVLVIDMVSAT